MSAEQETILRDAVTPEVDTGAELARGAFVNIMSLVAANLRAIFTLLIGRLLGRATLGTFGIAWSVTDLLSEFGSFGMETSTIALVSARQAKGDAAGTRALMRRAVSFSMLFSVLIATLGIIGFQTLGPRFGQRPELIRCASVMLLAVPGIVLYRVCNGVSRGMKVMKHDLYSKGFTETWATVICFIIAFFLGFGDLAPVVGVVLGTAAGGLMAFFLARSLVARTKAARGERTTASLIRFSAPIAIYGLLNLLIMRMDVLLLAFLGRRNGITMGTIGIFVASVEISGGMRKVRQAFDPMFTPIIARQSAAQDKAAMQESFAQLARWVLAAQLPLMGVLCLAGGIGLDIFGPNFRGGELWVALLAIAHATNSFVGLAETVIMIQRPNLNLVNSGVTVLLQLACSFILIPPFGATGAAFCMLIAYFTQGVLRYFELRYVFKWKFPWPALVRPMIAFVIALAVALPLRFLLHGRVAEVSSGLTFIAAYVGAWAWIGLEEKDRVVLRQLRAGGRRRPVEPDELA
ncbi:MAG TPA: oligosaccharide flippase family protein [Chthoniobacterales bacterium]|jgi:O-antigen/teichoic acid export membrane protein